MCALLHKTRLNIMLVAELYESARSNCLCRLIENDGIGSCSQQCLSERNLLLLIEVKEKGQPSGTVSAQ